MKAYSAQLKRPNKERDALIASHLEVARRIASRIARRCPAFIAREDLHAAAMLGLTEAAERYDSSREEPFLGFAEKRIRGAILDELRRGDILPRRTRQLARKIGHMIAQLEKEYGRPPIDEEVAEALGVSLEEYKNELEQLVHVQVGSLDADRDGMANSDASPETQASKREVLRQVRAALPRLEARDVLVLSLYYNEELTYPEIGEVLKVTTSRVCQLHGRAIARLRAEIELAGSKEAA
ncbi:MAG: sigma-70 family RNA polymerase sigma factor [Kofleriaceae bacterium]